MRACQACQVHVYNFPGMGHGFIPEFSEDCVGVNDRTELTQFAAKMSRICVSSVTWCGHGRFMVRTL